MHANLAPGESLLPGTLEAVGALMEDARVDAVLLPLVPSGDGVLARAARRYLRAWDARFLHRQNFFVPASRVVTRAPLDGWRNADAVPHLEQSIAAGRFVEALPSRRLPPVGVASPIARDVGAWVAWARAEGEAWGALAAREPRFAPFLPVLSRRGWARHNVWQAPHRAGEVVEAMRRPDVLAVSLHVLREAAWTRGGLPHRH